MWSSTAHEVGVVELMVCFETKYDDAQTLKTNRYTDLMEQIAGALLDGRLVTLKVGSRGFLSLPSFNTLK